MSVFPDAIGTTTRPRELLPYGDMAFNAFGPRNALFDRAFAKAEPVMAFILSRCRRDALRQAASAHECFARRGRAGQLSEEEAALLVRSLLTAGIDTTVRGIGNALVALARHPDQWARLHAAPALARQAFDEAVRYESPVQTFLGRPRPTSTLPAFIGAERRCSCSLELRTVTRGDGRRPQRSTSRATRPAMLALAPVSTAVSARWWRSSRERHCSVRWRIVSERSSWSVLPCCTNNT
jgi:hypothetical protein